MNLSRLIKTISNPRIILACGSFFGYLVFPQHAYAQYNGSVNPLSQNWSLPSENTLNFSSTANDQSYTCSFGGGTRSMLYAGLFSGIDQTFVQNEVTNTNGHSYSTYPVTHPYSHGAGAGFIIPLRSPIEKQMSESCIRILTLVETEEIMQLLYKFKAKGIISEEEYQARMSSLKNKILNITSEK